MQMGTIMRNRSNSPQDDPRAAPDDHGEANCIEQVRQVAQLDIPFHR